MFDPVTYALAVKNGGGGGGTSNYNSLENKPQINGVTLSGDKSTEDLIPIGDGLSFNADGELEAAVGNTTETSINSVSVSPSLSIDNEGYIHFNSGTYSAVNVVSKVNTEVSLILTVTNGYGTAMDNLLAKTIRSYDSSGNYTDYSIETGVTSVDVTVHPNCKVEFYNMSGDSCLWYYNDSTSGTPNILGTGEMAYFVVPEDADVDADIAIMCQTFDGREQWFELYPQNMTTEWARDVVPVLGE